jgi:two-component system, NarL family, invasion response regulator UvrY
MNENWLSWKCQCALVARRGSKRNVKVLIIDDHPIVISGCRALLAQRPELSLIEALDGEEGCKLYDRHKPDVAVIDIRLPGASGFEIARRILIKDPLARIIIFSMNDDPIFAARAIECGAKGYLAKNDDPNNFVKAIVEVAAGGVFLNPEIARKLAFHNIKGAENPIARLSPRELEIIRLLCSGKSTAEIAGDINVSYKTAANACSALKGKLGARTMVDLVRIALEHKLA